MKIQEAQNKRKKGYWILVNKKMTKVLFVSKNKDDVLEKFNKSKHKYFAPLKKVVITKQDIKEAEEMYKKGLMCNYV